jgi:4-hydroxy-3-polyprenylbenzoate decarboxylase
MKMTMVPEITDMDMPVEGVFHNLVIAQLRKEYAGQGQKVMNAMWGAGQMMFNKILVIADEGVKIQDYKALSEYVFKNCNPATDIYFSQGPMDVLDHSCSKLGFGGKMCIDGTSKYEEERDESFELPVERWSLTSDDLMQQFPEIRSANTALLEQGIPVLLLAVEKNRKGHIAQLHNKVCAFEKVEGIKLILYVEHTVDAADLTVALWRFCNNLDPKRDRMLVQQPSATLPDKTFACMGLDGTRKTKELDNFQRDWPNIIVADDATIAAVDAKWHKLGLSAFLPSPSLKFKNQVYGEEAVVA